MNPKHFQEQVKRLVNTFGAGAYGQERVNLLWRDLENLSDGWLTRTVDDFIGSLHKAPLLTEFREKAAIERERIWKLEKQQHSRESEEAFKSIYADEEIKNICKSIRKIAKGEMPENDRQAFLRSLKGSTGGES